jgi:phosphoglycolate phosphatase
MSPTVSRAKIPQAVIFDLDGTLVDSLADIACAMNEVLQSFGRVPHGIERYGSFVGEGAEHLVRTAFAATTENIPEAQVPSALEQYRNAYLHLDDRLARPYEGIIDCLRALQTQKIPLAVLSNKRDDFVKRLVGRHFGTIDFVEVRGHRAGVPLKPDATAAFEVALALDVIPHNIVFVGDTAVDWQTAQGANMSFRGVAWGFRPDEIRQRVFVETPAQLQASLLGVRHGA